MLVGDQLIQPRDCPARVIKQDLTKDANQRFQPSSNASQTHLRALACGKRGRCLMELRLMLSFSRSGFPGRVDISKVPGRIATNLESKPL